MDVALFDGFFLQHLARNFFERGIHSGLGCDFFGGLVQFESELPAQDIDGGLLRGVGAFAAGFPDFGGNGVYVGAGNGRIHCGDMHHASGFHAVQPDVAADGRGVVKLKDELAVGGLALFLFFEAVFAV